jgi:hypothetical protein
MRKRGDQVKLHEVETSLALYHKRQDRLFSPQPAKRETFDNSKMRARRVLDTPK